MWNRRTEKLAQKAVIAVGVLLVLAFYFLYVSYFRDLRTENQEQNRAEQALVQEAPERPLDVEPAMLDFAALGPPSLEKALTVASSSWFREIEIRFPAGDSGVDIAVKHDEPIGSGGTQGIAVRTKNDAILLSSTELVSIARPDSCDQGCSLVLWLTMGREFQQRHEGARIMIYAEDDVRVTITEIAATPPQMSN